MGLKIPIKAVFIHFKFGNIGDSQWKPCIIPKYIIDTIVLLKIPGMKQIYCVKTPVKYSAINCTVPSILLNPVYLFIEKLIIVIKSATGIKTK